jgi:hypothetical protein
LKIRELWMRLNPGAYYARTNDCLCPICQFGQACRMHDGTSLGKTGDGKQK